MATSVMTYDPIRKKKTLVHHAYGEDTAIFQSITDVTDIIELNKAQYAITDERAGWKGDIHMVARIPLDTMFRLKQEGKIDRDGFATEEGSAQLMKLLDDPSYRDLRTRPGRLSR